MQNIFVTKFWALILAILLSSCSSHGAKILFYFGVSTYSHRVAVWPLVEALAAKGHNVTFFGPEQPIGKNPAIIEFYPSIMTRLDTNVTEELFIQLRLQGRQSEVWNSLPNFGRDVCEAYVKDPEIRDWVKSADYDLVILAAFFNDCGLALAYKAKAKYIMFSPTSMLMWMPSEFGHVPETSWIPETDVQFSSKMTFLERVYNTLSPLYWHFWVRGQNYFPQVEQILRTNLDMPDMPSLLELWRNTSLVFINTHHSFEFARSLPPLYVPVGGMHIKETLDPKKNVLSKELSEFIEGSGPNGFVYFSFGSVASASALPLELRQVFYDVFASFKTVRFVWVFDIDRPEGMPENVFTLKFANQQALLSHKRIKAFITQAGAMSLQEAIHYEVPAILFPLFGDQNTNSEALKRHGCGIKLEIRGLERDTLRKAISDILSDTSFKTKMTQLSKIVNDRQISPLDTAVWWTEFVLRNEDTSFLKPLSRNQTWYEIRLLDVWGFIFVCILSAFLAVVFVVKFSFKVLCPRRGPVSVKKSKKKL